MCQKFFVLFLCRHGNILKCSLSFHILKTLGKSFKSLWMESLFLPVWTRIKHLMVFISCVAALLNVSWMIYKTESGSPHVAAAGGISEIKQQPSHTWTENKRKWRTCNIMCNFDIIIFCEHTKQDETTWDFLSFVSEIYYFSPNIFFIRCVFKTVFTFLVWHFSTQTGRNIVIYFALTFNLIWRVWPKCEEVLERMLKSEHVNFHWSLTEPQIIIQVSKGVFGRCSVFLSLDSHDD